MEASAVSAPQVFRMPCSMLCPLYCRVSTIHGMCIEFPGQVADLGDRPTVPFFIQPMCWLGILLFAGIVMALYALLRSNPSASAAEIEEGLDGNLCRCTGACPVCASNILLQMLAVAGGDDVLCFADGEKPYPMLASGLFSNAAFSSPLRPVLFFEC